MVEGKAAGSAVRLLAAARQRYRASGADLPFGDSLPWHGVAMEGYFWRFTDPEHARVMIALVGINTPAVGGPWATVGVAGEPWRVLRTAVLDQAWADPDRLGVGAGAENGPPATTDISVPAVVIPEVPDVTTGGRSVSAVPTTGGFRDGVRADATGVRVRLGGDALDVTVTQPRAWPRVGVHRAFGGSSVFQVVPGLNQYWHPWLLGGRAHGTAVLGGESIKVAGWQVYAEKNWGGGGFPEAWWWGQAQGFEEPSAVVAFAGGRITAGPSLGGRRLSTEVTALVVGLPNGRVVRLGNPVVSAVRAQVRPGSWVLRGRSARWRIDVEAAAEPAKAYVLPVPLVGERRNVPGDLEHLTGELRIVVREWGRLVWQGNTRVAALEVGGREVASAELARRGGDPLPRV